MKSLLFGFALLVSQLASASSANIFEFCILKSAIKTYDSGVVSIVENIVLRGATYQMFPYIKIQYSSATGEYPYTSMDGNSFDSQYIKSTSVKEIKPRYSFTGNAIEEMLASFSVEYKNILRLNSKIDSIKINFMQSPANTPNVMILENQKRLISDLFIKYQCSTR